MDAPNFTHLFDRHQRHFRRAMQYLPQMVGNDARNFFLDSFRHRAWANNGMEAWPPRKKVSKWGKKNDPGRALLVQTGRLRHSIRILDLHFGQVTVGTDVPYAKMHNQGIRGQITQNVGAHTRKKMGRRQVIIASRSLKTRTNITWGRPQTGQTNVRAFQRRLRMNLPRRQFMGQSQYLTRIIQRRIAAELAKIDRI